MTITFKNGGVAIVSNELGVVSGDSLLLYHYAKLLSEHPENKNVSDILTKDGSRVIAFDYFAEDME